MKTISIIAAAVLSAVALYAMEDQHVIADTLYLEARGEGEHGMRAVATVIYNRAGGDAENMVAVCLKPKQFSCWNGSRRRDIAPTSPPDIKAYNTCLAIEKELLTGDFKPLGNWTHYYAYRICSPKWARGAKTTVIGNHKFLTVKQ